MSKESYEKLAEASRKASEDGAKHVIATLKDGKLILSGAQNLVLSLVEDAELFNRLQNLMLEKTNNDEENVLPGTKQLPEYPLLPFSPFSPEWKGSADIRHILRDMLSAAGFKAMGRKKTMGVGPSPLGWPSTIPWAEFKGTTRSKLSSLDISEIIVSMLRAVDVDPATHVVPKTVVEDDALVIDDPVVAVVVEETGIGNVNAMANDALGTTIEDGSIVVNVAVEEDGTITEVEHVIDDGTEMNDDIVMEEETIREDGIVMDVAEADQIEEGGGCSANYSDTEKDINENPRKRSCGI